MPRVLAAALSLAGAGACMPPTPLPARPHSAPAVPDATKPPIPLVVRSEGARQGSALLLADVDGRRIAYVSDEDDARIRVVDVEDEREVSSFAPGGVPAQMVMLPDGRLVVAVRDGARLVVLRGTGTAASPLTMDVRIDVPAEPIGLALSSDDRTVVVTSGWGHAVTVLDTSTFVRKATHTVAREPRSVVIASDDSRAFVSHAVGQSMEIVPLGEVASPPPKPIKLAGREEVASDHDFFATRARDACQGFALAKSESGRIFAPHVLVFAGEPAPSSGYGGGDDGGDAEVFHVPVIDEDASAMVGESRMLRIGMGIPRRCSLPRAAVVGKAGLYVTCLGEDTVQLFDADAPNPHDVDLKTWRVPAGPTAIALDESQHRAFVWSQFAHALTKIAIGRDGMADAPAFSLSSLTLARLDEDPKFERGRQLFHATTDPRISSDGRACASCHPDGRDDTLVWSSPKGPRQTPMLAGRLRGSAPFGWNGDAPDVAKHLVQTVKRLGGKGLEGPDKEALMAYVDAMRAPPLVTASRDVDPIRRGEAIFHSEKAGCGTCHGASGDLPDGERHDVKSRSGNDLEAKFDVPSLRFVGGTAPYFHDGRYADLRTLLVKSDGRMGHTKHLSATELDDLVSFLESL